MPTIIISDHAYHCVQSRALIPFEQPGIQRSSGQWAVFVSSEHVARIVPHTQPHESIGEYIERMYPPESVLEEETA